MDRVLFSMPPSSLPACLTSHHHHYLPSCTPLYGTGGGLDRGWMGFFAGSLTLHTCATHHAHLCPHAPCTPFLLPAPPFFTTTYPHHTLPLISLPHPSPTTLLNPLHIPAPYMPMPHHHTTFVPFTLPTPPQLLYHVYVFLPSTFPHPSLPFYPTMPATPAYPPHLLPPPPLPLPPHLSYILVFYHHFSPYLPTSPCH